jgi:hypothetical protein
VVVDLVDVKMIVEWGSTKVVKEVDIEMEGIVFVWLVYHR